jgi:hypothetical protein
MLFAIGQKNQRKNINRYVIERVHLVDESIINVINNTIQNFMLKLYCDIIYQQLNDL